MCIGLHLLLVVLYLAQGKFHLNLVRISYHPIPPQPIPSPAFLSPPHHPGPDCEAGTNEMELVNAQC